MRNILSPLFRKPAFTASLIASLFVSEAVIAKFKDLVPTSDASISDAQVDTVLSGGTNTSLFLQSSTGAFGNEHVWLQFDLSDAIPNAANISSAKVRFYLWSAEEVDGGLPIEAIGVDDNWSETNLTWNTAAAINVLDSTPAAGNVASQENLVQGKEFIWYELDVTQFVQDQFQNDSSKLVSIALEIQSGSESSANEIQFRFNSKEHDPGDFVQGTLGPKLRVEYTGNWPTSANDITIIHTNDIHSRLSTHDLDFPDADGEAPQFVEAGGAQNVAAKVMEINVANPNAIVIDAGDISEGSPLGDLRGNGGTVDFFQELHTSLIAEGFRGIDGIVVGNHDVRESAMLDNMRDPDGDGNINGWVDTNNDGAFDVFNPITTDADDVPYLAVNLHTFGASVPGPAAWPIELPYRPYSLITLPGSVTVAVLGYITDDSAILTGETENLIEIKETVWSDDDPSTVDLKEWVNHLRTIENADVVVLLSHIGHRRLNATTQPLLGDGGDVAPPDVVVSGHWHTWTKTAWQPSNLNYKTTNVEAASYGQYVGELTLTPQGRYLNAVKHPIEVANITIPATGPVRRVYDDVNTLMAALESEYNAQTSSDPEHDPCVLVENGSLTEAQVQATLATYSTGDNCPLNLVVGESLVDLNLDKDKWNTLSEFPWSGDNTAGAWITDGMVWKVRQLPTNLNPNANLADLAFQTGGGVRRDLAAGELTYQEIYEAYPWDDDGMVRVQMNSQQIVDFLEDKFVGASISSQWRVTATDGQIDLVEVDTDSNGSYETTLDRSDTSTIWNVIISEYMYENEDFISEATGNTNTFDEIDPTPEYLLPDGTTVGTPSSTPLEIRNSVIEYTHANSPINVIGPRYILNTEIAGEFEAVITMLNDAEEQPYFEAAFIRLLKASPETIARRNQPGNVWGLDDLIDAEGNIIPGHEFSETMLYRSHLGFADGYLKVGDRLMINGEFGFFAGNPQFVDQEGILSAEEEFNILGNDPSLALASYMPTTSSFLNEQLENHLVTFFAERLTSNTVRDSEGNVITVYREGGFFSSSTFLAGADGDCIQLTGVHTERADRTPSRRFRLRDSVFVDAFPETCFPPTSEAEISGNAEVGGLLTLTASASDLNGIQETGGSGGIDDSIVYNNIQGNSFFAGMDLNGDGEAAEQTLTFSDINISGEVGLNFSAFFAEDQASNGAEDWDTTDFVKVEYRIDGGAWTNLFAIENDGVGTGSGFNSAPFVDTDFDGTGDGAEITDTFTQYSAAISGSGAVLDVRIIVALEAGDEDIAIDQFEISSSTGPILIEDFEDADVTYTISPATAEYSDGFFDFFIRVSPITTNQLVGTVQSVAFFYILDGGAPVLIGTDSDGSNGWSFDFVPTNAGEYQFYSVATDDDGNTEIAPVYSDDSITVTGSSIIIEPEIDDEIPFLPLWAMWLLAAAFGGFSFVNRRKSRS